MQPTDLKERVRSAVDVRQLADDLGVRITRRRGTWWAAHCPVPEHDDTDPSAGIGPNGYRCHGCGASGDAFELYQLLTDVDFRTSVAELAERAGIDVANAPRGRRHRPTTPPATSSTLQQTNPEHRTAQWVRRRAEVRESYEVIWSRLGLSDEARTYLEGRAIPSEAAEHVGIRSATPDEWANVCADLSDDLLEDAGLYRSSGRVYPATSHYGDTPFLVVPYWRRGEGGADTLRFRRIRKSHAPKVVSVCSTDYTSTEHVTCPYLGWGAVDYARRHQVPLYVTEGALDALAVSLYRPAVATWSAHTWRRRWCEGWADLQAVVVLTDGDDAGESLAGRLARAALESDGVGPTWVDTRLHSRSLGGMDPNEALEAGILRERLDEIETIQIENPDGAGIAPSGHTSTGESRHVQHTA